MLYGRWYSKKQFMKQKGILQDENLYVKVVITYADTIINDGYISIKTL